jgi:hypothetical protein
MPGLLSVGRKKLSAPVEATRLDENVFLLWMAMPPRQDRQR